jgi:predicted Zn-ribbon and HTH transcriptional regulator
MGRWHSKKDVDKAIGRAVDNDYSYKKNKGRNHIAGDLSCEDCGTKVKSVSSTPRCSSCEADRIDRATRKHDNRECD